MEKNSKLDFSNKMKIDFMSSEEIYIEFPLFDISSVVSTKSNVLKHIKLLSANISDSVEIILCFKSNLSFQDYITFKSMLLTSDLKNVTISNQEFISN